MPNIPVGEFKYEHKSIRIYNEDTKTFLMYNKCCDLKDFERYGPGIYLFFDWMKQLIICFFIMSLLAGVSIFCNWNGKKFQQSEVTTQLDYTLLGNNALDPETESLTNEAIDWGKIGYSTNSRTLGLLADYAYTIFFFLFVLYYNWRLKKKIVEAKKEAVFISNYSVEVSNLPEGATAEQLRQIMSNFGKVAEVTIGRNYLGHFHDFDNAKDLEVKLRYSWGIRQNYGANAEIDSQIEVLKNKVIEKKKKIAGQLQKEGISLANHSDFPAFNAYVIFERLEDKTRLMKKFHKIKQNHRLAMIFCCIKKKDLIEYDGKSLSFKNCDEPSNIAYENVSEKTSKKIYARLLTFLAIICVILADFVSLYLLGKVNFSPRNSSCVTTPTYEQMEADEAMRSNGDSRYCFCRKLPIDQLLSSKNSPYCTEYYYSYTYGIVLNVGSSIVIMVSNVVLRTMVNKLSSKMLFNKVTSQVSIVTIIIFLSEFVNFIVITIFMRGSFYGFEASVYLSHLMGKIHPSLVDKNPIYKAYNSSWYLDIGAQIMYELMLEILIPHIFLIFWKPLVKWMKFRKANTGKLQYDVINNMVPSKFDLPPKAAHILSQVFVAVLLCSGIPTLVPCCFLFLTSYYWVQKSIFLNYSKVPKQIDESFVDLIGKVLYFAVFIHCIMGYFLYSSQGIFSLPPGLSSMPNIGSDIPVIGSPNVSQFVVFFIVGSLSLVMISWHFAIWPLIDFLGVFNLCIKQQEEEIVAPTPDTELDTGAKVITKGYSEEKKKLSEYSCTSYNILNNPEYHDIVLAMEIDTTRQSPKVSIIPEGVRSTASSAKTQANNKGISPFKSPDGKVMPNKGQSGFKQNRVMPMAPAQQMRPGNPQQTLPNLQRGRGGPQTRPGGMSDRPGPNGQQGRQLSPMRQPQMSQGGSPPPRGQPGRPASNLANQQGGRPPGMMLPGQMRGGNMRGGMRGGLMRG